MSFTARCLPWRSACEMRRNRLFQAYHYTKRLSWHHTRANQEYTSTRDCLDKVIELAVFASVHLILSPMLNG
jgi:hypothetical protein